MSGFWPSLLALLPTLIGPLPEAQQTLLIQTCLGGQIELPLGDPAPEDPDQCHQQGCHARCTRSGEDDMN